MKKAVIGFVFLIVMMNCGPSKNRVERTFEEGVEVIINPIEPLYSSDVLDLRENLIIGPSGEGRDVLFERIAAVKVDKAGNIYVLDHTAFHVLKFDPDGNLVKEFGRKGQGPGEFEFPMGMQIVNDEVMISDMNMNRLIFFNLDGEYQRHLNMMLRDTDPHLDSSGNIIAQSAKPGDPWIVSLNRYNNKAELQHMIDKFEFFRNPNRIDVLAPIYINYTVSNDDQVVWGVADKYELNVVDKSGHLIRKIRKKYIPSKILQEERDRLMERYHESGQKIYIPENYPPIRDLSSDDEGRIFVYQYETDLNNGRYYDVFNSEGRFHSIMKLNNQPAHWRDGKLYCIAEDEDGYQFIKRYQVNWRH